ncbi:MAG: ParB/RepB/Spo0J family partition protein [Mogibacterium sp.]|nr:ParB/RepB/Spo0J family partition protein [Mogibacterium sp.]
MPKETGNEIKLPSLDELFSSQEERDDAKLKRIHVIPINEIDPFPDHPFKVRDDEDMMNLIESIRAQGVLTPCMVRKKKDGRYELISGHRRKRACELLGMDTLRCEIVELSKEQATILMTESNFQRSTILPSEKAFAYKMRLDAMKMLVSRMVENQKKGRNYGGEPVGPQLEKAREHLINSYGLTEEYAGALGNAESRRHDHDQGAPVGHLPSGMKSRDVIAVNMGESKSQIQRYIRLTELIPELLDLVDEGKMGIRPAVELSYLGPRQRDVLEAIEMEQCTPTHEQAKRMRKLYEEQKLTPESIEAVMMEQKGNQKERIVLRSERFSRLFPPDLPASKREDYVAAAMEYYARHRQRQRDRDDAR